jgi:AhpD family alkylhydroperoxidase
LRSCFRKRYYTPRTFARDLRRVLANMGDFRDTVRSGRVSRAFAEKVMLAVTAVNGCRYCAYGHSHWALEAGVEPGEVKRLLASDLGEFPEEEAVALAFAQHWAETAGAPDPEAERRFRDYYGDRVSDDILNWMHMIQMGNLLGNTFDAILWQLGLARRAA